MPKEKVSRTPEQKSELIAQVKELRAKEDLSVKAACDKAGITVNQFYTWEPVRKKRGKKVVTRRKKAPVVVTALVPALPSEQDPLGMGTTGEGGGKPVNAQQVAEILATMNATSLRVLLSRSH